MSARPDHDLEQRYPVIPWREPIRVALGNGMHFGCRFCIALHGLKGSDVDKLPTDSDSVRRHIKECHCDG